MDTKEFIEKSTRQIEQMSPKEIKETLLNLVRLTPKSERFKIFQILDGQNESKFSTASYFQNWFEKISLLDIHFEAEYFEIYDSSPWASEGNYVFQDPHGIREKIIEILEFAKICLYQKEYILAFELYLECCAFPFQIFDVDSETVMEFDLEALVAQEALTVDLSEIASHLLYATYQTTLPQKRVATFVRYFSQWDMCQKISLNDVFSVGPEHLPDSSLFLQEWLLFFEEDTSLFGQKLYKEALQIPNVFESASDLFFLAKKVGAKQPESFLVCLEMAIASNDWEFAKEIIQQSFKTIPRLVPVRAKIAKHGIKVSKNLFDSNFEHQTIQEIFYSDPTIDALLNLLNHGIDSFEKEACLSFVRSSKRKNRSEFLLFLEAFEDVYQTEKRNRKALGWSTLSKGKIIPLFLLVMNKQIDSPAANFILENILYRISEQPIDSFKEQFKNWALSIEISSTDQLRYLTWCRKEIERRADELIDTRFRNHYKGIAALLMLLAETEENCGLLNAKQHTFEKYRSMHSRKSSFTRELKAFYSF